jgi:hypothetical protein
MLLGAITMAHYAPMAAREASRDDLTQVHELTAPSNAQARTVNACRRTERYRSSDRLRLAIS